LCGWEAGIRNGTCRARSEDLLKFYTLNYLIIQPFRRGLDSLDSNYAGQLK